MKEKYEPLEGFYDLREFDIPKKEFKKLWNIQKFLYQCQKRINLGFAHPRWEEIKQVAADYQRALFSFPYKVGNQNSQKNNRPNG